MPAARPTTLRPAQVRVRIPRRGRTVALATGLALSSALGLAACGATAPDETDGTGGATEAASPAASGFPLDLENCGVPVELEAAPERVVTIKSSATEMVLALGAGDRLVGHAFPDAPVPAELLDGGTEPPLLSEKVPSAEVVLETEPDLVYAGWESNLTAEAGGDRATLAGLGVATYVSPSACKDPAHRPERLTFDEVAAEIREAGALLGVPEAAERLVTQQQEVLDGIEPDGRGLTALWYSSGTDVPYVGAGIGAPQMLMDAVGLENIAAGVEDTWTPFSWEQVAEDDPDVIVLVDSAWNSAEAKRELLATSPATAELSAVRAERYLVVPFPATEAGVRNAAAAADLADQLAVLEVG